MGKKKPQKTKELAVAIAEASSTRDETQQQPQVLAQPPQTPRKRGRPRKIIEKIEDEEMNVEPAEEAVVEGGEAVVGSDVKEEVKSSSCQEVMEQPSASARGRKKEEERLQERETALRRSRRKITKPMKSI